MRQIVFLSACLMLMGCGAGRKEPTVAPTAVRSAVTIIGEVDDPAALQAYLAKVQDEDKALYEEMPMVAIAARSVDGGEKHPRLTLVYMTTQAWCGSGGCELLILEPGPSGLVELSSVSISHPPVRVLATRSNGMPDLSVQVRQDYYPGDGPKFVGLSFDGHHYAGNPTVPPSRLLPRGVEGEVVISEADADAAFRLTVPPAA